ncbi:MAG: type II secretion system F family protein [Deltaproteobacteria bacterium]|nr:type II secretion system F family protein [Deltaproteobacteria bacterium]
MQKFLYKAKDGRKQVMQGILEAETERGALSKLSQMGYFPLSIQKEEAGPQRQASSRSFSIFTGIRRRDITFFTRQLSDLLEAGLTLMRALNVIQDQTENPRLQEILGDIVSHVRDGKSFSDALAVYPKVFPPIYVSMVRSGEVGGILGGVLARLADFSEKEEELQGKVRAAMAYPALICLVGMGTVAVLLIFVVPKLVLLFQDVGQVLPLPTQILIAVSNGVAKYWWVALLIAALGGFLGKRQSLPQGARLAIDRIKLRFPVWGSLIKKVEIARFARSLATLLSHGVPILQAMQSVYQATGNEMLKGELQKIGDQLRGGTTLSQGMRLSRIFPNLVINMVSVGEEAGSLDRSLIKIADTYEREADRAMKMMTALVEPVMILVMGSVVGFIVVSMLLPIFQIDILAR